MRIVTNDNFTPFNSIPSLPNPEESPDIVVYPDMFSGKTADIMVEKLSHLKYQTTQYCIANKLSKSPRKMLWIADDPNWTYVFSKNHMFGLEAEEFPIFIRCIQWGVQQVTGQKFNACLINMYESGDDMIDWYSDDDAWLGDNFIVPSISFGDIRRFQLRSKSDHKKKYVIRTENGSMIVMRDTIQQYWQHNIPKESKLKSVRFNLTFRNIHSDLVSKMPKARSMCAGKKVVYFGVNKIPITPLPSDAYKVPTPDDDGLIPSPSPTPSGKMGKLDDIYLNIKQRIALISQIQKVMSKVIKGHGVDCVNGPKATLLKQLELKKLLGRGTFGNVYDSCAPAPCDDESYRFAVKLATMTNSDFKFPYAQYKQPWHEVYILKDMINPLVENGICPNLPLLAESYTCSDCIFSFYGRKKGGPLELLENKSPCLILLMELATGGDMVRWFGTNPSEKEVYSALFQMMAGVHTIQAHGQIMNNDVKAENTLSYNVTPGGYWHYVIHGQNFYVPNLGKLFILNDFGVSTVFSPDHKLVQKKSDKWVGLGNRYAMIINGKYSPLNAKYSFSWDKQYAPTNVHWVRYEHPNWKQIAKSNGGNAQIAMKSNKIHNPEIEFTPEQITELKRLGIPADSGNIDFYKHPEVIPAIQVATDTQDVIRTFTGGKRTSQPGDHKHYKAVTPAIIKLLEPYVTRVLNMYGSNFNNDPSKNIAGYFLVDFFTKKYNYTKLPVGEKVIAKYVIS